jgi:hypothetical protein
MLVTALAIAAPLQNFAGGAQPAASGARADRLPALQQTLSRDANPPGWEATRSQADVSPVADPGQPDVPPIAAFHRSPARPAWLGQFADGVGLIGMALPVAYLALFVAAMVAALAVVVAGRRLRAGSEATQAAIGTAGKLFEAAARRFSGTQEETAAALEAAAAASAQAGQAAHRLAGATRHAEERLRDCVAEAEARLHAAASLAGTLQQEASALPARMTEAVEVAAAGLLRRLEGLAMSLQEGASATLVHIETESRALPALLADAIRAGAARALPALEGATARFADQSAIVSAALDTLPEACRALQAAAGAIVHTGDAQLAALAGVAVRAEGALARLPEAADSLMSAAASLRQDVAQSVETMDVSGAALAGAALAASETVVRMAGAAERIGALPGAAQDLLEGAAALRHESAAMADAARSRRHEADVLLTRGQETALSLHLAGESLGVLASRMQLALDEAAAVQASHAASHDEQAKSFDTAARQLRSDAEAMHVLADRAVTALAAQEHAAGRAAQSLSSVPDAVDGLRMLCTKVEATASALSAAGEEFRRDGAVLQDGLAATHEDLSHAGLALQTAAMRVADEVAAQNAASANLTALSAAAIQAQNAAAAALGQQAEAAAAAQVAAAQAVAKGAAASAQGQDAAASVCAAVAAMARQEATAKLTVEAERAAAAKDLATQAARMEALVEIMHDLAARIEAARPDIATPGEGGAWQSAAQVQGAQGPGAQGASAELLDSLLREVQASSARMAQAADAQEQAASRVLHAATAVLACLPPAPAVIAGQTSQLAEGAAQLPPCDEVQRLA